MSNGDNNKIPLLCKTPKDGGSPDFDAFFRPGGVFCVTEAFQYPTHS